MAETAPEVFFKIKRSMPDIKAEVYIRFFMEWCRVYLAGGENKQELFQVDLFAGQGLGEELFPAAPLQLLENIRSSAATDLDISQSVKLFFNDPSNAVIERLKSQLESLNYYEELKHPPLLLNQEENQLQLTELLTSSLPGLIYVDPFGYAYARQVVAQVLQGAKADLFMLFSTQKLRSAMLSEEETILTKLFGRNFKEIKGRFLQEKSARKRELLLIEMLEEAFRRKGFYLFNFKIEQPEKTPVGYYILFASKAKQAYFRMKEFMCKYSDVEEDGVPLFSVNQHVEQPSIPGFYKVLNKFCIENLVEDLASKRSKYHYQTVQEVFEDHSIGTNYVRANYKVALEKLREAGQISLVDMSNKQVKNITGTAILFYKLHGIKKQQKV